MKRARAPNLFRRFETFFQQFTYGQNPKNGPDEVLRKITRNHRKDFVLFSAGAIAKVQCISLHLNRFQRPDSQVSAGIPKNLPVTAYYGLKLYGPFSP